MAPVEFTISYGDGDPLDFCAALSGRCSLIVVTSPDSWNLLSGLSTVVAGVRFAVLDLRRFGSPADLPAISDMPGDVVALHHTREWDFEPVVAAVRALGRPVVLFVAAHTWVSALDPSCALVGWSGRYVVVGVPTGSGAGRVEDLVFGFSEWERAGMALYPGAPRFEIPVVEQPSFREVTTRVALPGATEPVIGALRPGTAYEVWVRIGPQHGARDELTLRAVLSLDGLQASEFVLPGGDASPWLSFPVTTPDAATTWTGDLIIYSGVVPVHVEEVALPVEVDGTFGSTVRHRLTTTFADLGFSGRVASILVSGSRALVNSAGGLKWSSLPVVDDPWRLLEDLRFTLDPWHGKDFPSFCADLAALAGFGARLHDRLFHDRFIPSLIRRGPAVLTVADLTGDCSVPWSLIYDLPFMVDQPYRVCLSAQRFGPFGAGGVVPAHCPEPDHSGNVLCPFGFWGLSAIVEQPSVPPGRIDGLDVTMAVDPGMDRRLTEQHVAALISLLPSVSAHYVSGSAELARLAADADVLYLYGRYLDHLPAFDGSPLVLVNSCHPGEVSALPAAGVVNTEVAVEQGMAGWVAEMLLTRLAVGASAGEALRQTRWEMISRGNVMGLAYSLRASADLRLRG